MHDIWNTEIIELKGVLRGPAKIPLQMLAEQEYDGHLSIHDDQQAQNLGFQGAPIEGPTHYSQFDPLLHSIWGDRWFEVGCISTHFKKVVIEGECVIAFVQRPTKQKNITRIWAEKDSGELVLEGTASLGPNHPTTELDRLLKSRSTPEKLVILENVKIGDRSSKSDRVKMSFQSHLGKNYPFTLAQKLKKITESCDWYCEAINKNTPWGAAIIPFEMVNPLVRHTPDGLPSAKGPSIGLFTDLEIKLINYGVVGVRLILAIFPSALIYREQIVQHAEVGAKKYQYLDDLLLRHPKSGNFINTVLSKKSSATKLIV